MPAPSGAITVGSGLARFGWTSLEVSSRSRTESGSGTDPGGTAFQGFQSDAARLVAIPRPSPFHCAWAMDGGVDGDDDARVRYRYALPPDSPVNSTCPVPPWLTLCCSSPLS